MTETAVEISNPSNELKIISSKRELKIRKKKSPTDSLPAIESDCFEENLQPIRECAIDAQQAACIVTHLEAEDKQQ